jgi:hypothetical protein
MGGGGSTYDYGFRIYNPQLGRFLSVDPLTSSYPWYTPYQFAGNKPIKFIDLDGLEEAEPKKDDGTTQVKKLDERTILQRLSSDTYMEQHFRADLKNFIINFFNWEGEGGNATFGVRWWTSNGETEENKKDRPAEGAKILDSDKAVLEGIGTRNGAFTIKSKTDNSSGDGRGSGNEGGKDWKNASEVTEASKEAANKVDAVPESANKEGIVKYGFKDKPGESNRFSSKPDGGNYSNDSSTVYEITPAGDTVGTSRISNF